jgi:hypothetical protein
MKILIQTFMPKKYSRTNSILFDVLLKHKDSNHENATELAIVSSDERIVDFSN